MLIIILFFISNVVTLGLGGFFLYKKLRKQNREQQKKLKDIINTELQDFFTNVYLNEQTPASYDSDIEDAEILEEELQELENSKTVEEEKIDSSKEDDDDFVAFDKTKKDSIH